MIGMDYEFQVIVIGGGHAGCEAALASARIGCPTLLITMNLDTIASMPCNPSIGGPGKGHIVREIDALGGAMADNIDNTYINVNRLNTSKGPAVQALRAQADKKLYQLRMKRVVETQDNLTTLQATVERITRLENTWAVELNTGERAAARAVVVTTGTFLNGLLHIGDLQYPGGRQGEAPSVGLSASLVELGFKLGRLKTGTVPRVRSRTIDYTKCGEQKPSDVPLMFSYFSEKRFPLPQVSCWITHTNESTHEVIRNHNHLSAMYSGKITGVGPRYCPSIEDKITRFPDRSRHPIFIEPEGFETEEVYLQGVSTSLPVWVQREILKTVPGLESVEIMRPGYAVEYDFVDPILLQPTLEAKHAPGIFCAGQINGTSGYEEAGGQGLVAGINSAMLCLNRPPLILNRSDGYIGIMIDDLVTKGTRDPYRIFTSRSEYRLLTRFDNADARLAHYGSCVGLLTDEKFSAIQKTLEEIDKTKKKLKMFHVKHSKDSYSQSYQHIVNKSLYELLKEPEIHFNDLQKHDPELNDVALEISERVEIEVKYEGYIARQEKQVNDIRKFVDLKIPVDIDFRSVISISNECREKLLVAKPESIARAMSVPGVSSADITALIYHIKKARPNV